MFIVIKYLILIYWNIFWLCREDLENYKTVYLKKDGTCPLSLTSPSKTVSVCDCELEGPAMVAIQYC